MLHGRPIRPEATLLIFDEIQECNAALNALKYFSEDGNQYHLACAGSLLGVTMLRPASSPVDKVDFLTLHPMSFIEFLEGNGDQALLGYLLAIDRIGDIPEIFFNPLEEKLKWFFVTGGMPEAIDAWVSDRDAGGVQAVLSDLLDACLLDFLQACRAGCRAANRCALEVAAFAACPREQEVRVWCREAWGAGARV